MLAVKQVFQTCINHVLHVTLHVTRIYIHGGLGEGFRTPYLPRPRRELNNGAIGDATSNVRLYGD